MPGILKILILEDNLADAEIVQRMLKKEKLDFEYRVAMTKNAYLLALDQFQPDLILADNSLPQFNAADALEIIKERMLQIPFIMVTGTTSEEFAATIIKAGADDYILKDRLARLPAAIDTAIKQRRAEKEKQLAIQNLIQSEEKRSLIMNAALDAIICINTEEKITFWNPQAEKIFGWKEEEIIGRKLSETIIPAGFRQMHEKGIGNHLECSSEPLLNVLFEIKATNRQQKEFPVELTVLPIKQGSEEFFCAFIRDITERKRSEEQVVKEKELSDSIINSLPGIFYLFDINGKYLRWNKNFETVSGFSHEEVSGMHPINFFDVDEQSLLTEKIEEVFTNGIADVEANFFTKDKKKIPYYFNGRAVSFEGQPCLIGMGIDITERKKAELQLSQDKQLLRTLIDNLPDYIYVKDRDLRHIINNISNIKLLGATSEAETLGKTVLDYFDHELAQQYIKDDRSILSNKKPIYNREEPIITNNGEKRWLLTTKLPLKDKDDNVLGLVGISRDITEQKKAEEKLNQSYEEIRQLASHLQEIREEERAAMAREVHDELGQQITGLKMDMSWLSKKINPQDLAIKLKIKEILTLLDGTIKTVRKIATDLRPSILDDLGLTEAMEWQSQEFEKRSGIKTMFSSSMSVNATGNIAIALFRIYQESLTNVARHAEASTVTSSLNEHEGQVILCITDNGKGFDITKTVGKKTLGLLGMKERSLMMGGQYQVISHPGNGTQVIVSVPLQTT